MECHIVIDHIKQFHWTFRFSLLITSIVPLVCWLPIQPKCGTKKKTVHNKFIGAIPWHVSGICDLKHFCVARAIRCGTFRVWIHNGMLSMTEKSTLHMNMLNEYDNFRLFIRCKMVQRSVVGTCVCAPSEPAVLTASVGEWVKTVEKRKHQLFLLIHTRY